MAFFLPFLLLCFTAGVRVSQTAPPLASPSPSVDCYSELFKLAGCLSFVANGNYSTKPDDQCCSALGNVVEEAPVCLCNLSSQGQGQGQAFNVNATKALTLPSACGIVSPCNISRAPAAAAPGQSPSCGAPSSVSGVEFLSGFAVALWLYYQSL